MAGILNFTDFGVAGGGASFSTGTSNGANPFDTEITKFGPDTFYNWEQDNVPVVELEYRTNWLYEFVGGQSVNSTYNPGVGGIGAVGGPSKISNNLGSGVTMVLSSTDDNANGVYSDMDSLIAALPKVIKYPTLVEICKYGDLGALNLHNFTCEGQGALEIVNRNFGVGNGGFSGTNAVSQVTSVSGFNTREGNVSETLVTAVSSNAMYFDVSSATSSKLGISCFDVSSWNNNYRSFMVEDFTTDSRLGPINFSYATMNGGGFGFTRASTDSDHTVFTASAYNDLIDLSISSTDATPATRNGWGESFRGAETDYPSVNTSSCSLAYGSYFTKVSVRNCHGEYIKLKNLMVDSGSSSGTLLQHQAPAGFDISDSEVILEGTASVRNRYYGYKIGNSKLKISKGLIAYRNYPMTNGVRNASSLEVENNIPYISSGVGFYSTNSTVEFDTVYDASNVQSIVSVQAKTPGKYLYHFSNNGTGIYSKNSVFVGGVGGHSASANFQGGSTYDYETTKLAATLNTQHGIVCDNSDFLYNGIPWTYRNGGKGFLSVNSTLGFIGCISEFNSGNGVELENSHATYGFGLDRYKGGVTGTDKRIGQGNRNSQIHCDGNGNHNLLITRSSSFKPQRTSEMAAFYGVIGGSRNGRSMSSSSGSFTSAIDYVPMVKVSDGSKAELISLGGSQRYNHTSTVPVKGYVASVTDNSEVTFVGTSGNVTSAWRETNISTSGLDLDLVQCRAAFYIGGNSTSKFCGPTKISGFGIGCLAEDNSKIKFGPILDDTGFFDNDGYSLSSVGDNHTKIEVHSLRSCLVANKNSEIEMKNLGGSSTVLDPDSNSIDRLFGNNYIGSTSAGYFQFYPNGFTDSITKSAGGKHSNHDYLSRVNISTPYTRNTISLGDQDLLSTGGMCVRAVNNSNVDVNKVNFPMGFSASGVSGVYYNLEGSANEHVTGYAGPGGDAYTPSSDSYYGGSQIFMWNISDSSRIHAANILVSGNTPSAVEYHGPAGAWWNDVPLDYYGSNGVASSASPDFTTTGYNNNGPFRLVLGTRGVVKQYYDLSSLSGEPQSLGATSSLGGTPIDQINGQGYMAPVSSVSAVVVAGTPNSHLYDIGELSNGGQPVFGSDGTSPTIQSRSLGTDPAVSVPVLNSDWQGYMRNFFDQSSADAFANVRHSSYDKIGFASVYNSTTSIEGGEGRDGESVTYGKGVRSLNIFDLDRLV